MDGGCGDGGGGASYSRTWPLMLTPRSMLMRVDGDLDVHVYIDV